MRKRFDIITLISSILFALVGIGICNSIRDVFGDTVVGTILWTAIFFTVPLLLGTLGVEFSLLLKRKKYQARYRSNRFRTIIVATIFCMLLGGIGQLVFMLEYQTVERTIEISDELDGMHLAVLMDDSDSMGDMRDACSEATCLLIDSLNEASSMQYIGFAGYTDRERVQRSVSDFLPMTDENKEMLKNIVINTDIGGGTYFDTPLTIAVETINQNLNPNYKSVILMLTDGVAPLSDFVKDEIINCDAEFYTLRIVEKANQNLSELTQELIALADEDFEIVQNSSGGVDISSVLQAMEEALAISSTITEEETKLALGTDNLVKETDTLYWWRVLSRIIVFALYAVIVAKTYYNKLSKGQMLLNLVQGLLIGVLAIFNLTAGLLLFVFVCLGAYTVFEIGEES